MEGLHSWGNLRPGRATYAANRRRHQLLLDDIPGWTCQQCGQPVFEERILEAIQHLLMTLDEGMERVSHWGRTQPRDGDGC
jgi:YgiT-type zinc finger domain-containing protein